MRFSLDIDLLEKYNWVVDVLQYSRPGYTLALDFIARIRGERQTIGIDIGHYSIKVVRVHHGRGGSRRVVAADLERVPDGAVVDCEIKDPGKLLEALSRVMTRSEEHTSELQSPDHLVC